jgi:hypothetical protein
VRYTNLVKLFGQKLKKKKTQSEYDMISWSPIHKSREQMVLSGVGDKKMGVIGF